MKNLEKQTKSAVIRALGREGLPVGEVARRVGVSYQHARAVLLAAGLLRIGNDARPETSSPQATSKPALTVDTLIAAGFQPLGRWVLDEHGELRLTGPAPDGAGVYAFVCEDKVRYVGLATMGLKRRLYFYGKPGASQRTNHRLNTLIKAALQAGQSIDVFIAEPEGTTWNGLPLCGPSGLEAGLIRAFALEWNMRGAI